MLTFDSKRYLSLFTLFMAFVGLYFLYCYWENNLISYHLKTGFALFGIIFFLILLNIRKKFPFLPLGKVSTWLRLHVYFAYFGIGLFFVHTGFRLPNGVFETFLYVLYFLVNISGVFGIWFSRIAPSRMTDSGGSMIYEAIPGFIYDQRVQVENLLLDNIKNSRQSTLSDFYLVRLKKYFAKPLFRWGLLFNSGHSLRELNDHMDRVSRYLNKDESETLDEMRFFVSEKLNLDIHFTYLTILKYWMFLHIPLSYALLFFGLYHGVLAYSFVGVH